MKHLLFPCLLLLTACQQQEPASSPGTSPTVAEAEAFMQATEKEAERLREQAARTGWLAQTHITHDTRLMAGEADKAYTLAGVNAASEAVRFKDLELDPVLARKMQQLKLDLTVPPPNDEALASELSDIGQELRAMYGTGKYCQGEQCFTLDEMGLILAESRDAALLKELWQGWRQVSPPMRPLYERQAVIANQGAQDLGFADISELWRSKYDMAPDDFAADMDRQWEMAKPVYDALHCHVRASLHEYYGDEVMSDSGKIPAHLLGNMWAQSWGNVYDLVAPPESPAGYDMNSLVEENYPDAEAMVRGAEAFFTSLGLRALPETFWERSQFTRPRDREVVCHASAWDIDMVEDVRIKMCINRNKEDFEVIHHELGHNYYQLAYADQPFLFRGSANDGFHEALGDTISLSVTPAYLVQLGLIEEEPPASEDMALLMRMALEKVAFLPFALLVDKWRWQVFSGELSPDEYNAGWWKLREQYQGVVAPVERTEEHFDPGAKYHVPDNTSYARYFLAHIQQFQFHKALCEITGYEGPLHRCTIYNNTEVGERLAAMMAMGTSQPWQDAMEALTGQRALDATALVDYFAPLKVWLDEQNKDRQCGW